MKVPKQPKHYEEYIDQYIGISTVGSGGAYYGKLTDFDERAKIFTLNPFKGPDMEEGKLVQKLIEKNRKITIPGNFGIDIFYCSENTIKEFCRRENEEYKDKNKD